MRTSHPGGRLQTSSGHVSGSPSFASSVVVTCISSIPDMQSFLSSFSTLVELSGFAELQRFFMVCTAIATNFLDVTTLMAAQRTSPAKKKAVADPYPFEQISFAPRCGHHSSLKATTDFVKISTIDTYVIMPADSAKDIARNVLFSTFTTNATAAPSEVHMPAASTNPKDNATFPSFIFQTLRAKELGARVSKIEISFFKKRRRSPFFRLLDPLQCRSSMETTCLQVEQQAFGFRVSRARRIS
mmetsp:Transcript_21082/g.70240  ORF Transcript_21082/g.70240 Transcript_21082/m.70240 type:complete len:243 (+) Transcript_21082:1009-1737(+)